MAGNTKLYNCFVCSGSLILLKGREIPGPQPYALPHRNMYSWKKQEIQILSKVDFFFFLNYGQQDKKSKWKERGFSAQICGCFVDLC